MHAPTRNAATAIMTNPETPFPRGSPRRAAPAPAPSRPGRTPGPGAPASSPHPAEAVPSRMSATPRARASTSPGGASTPSTPGSTISRVPSTAVATTGHPAISACGTTFGRPSHREVRRNTSKAAIRSGTSGRQPRNEKRSDIPIAATARSASPRISPSPTITKRESGISDATRRAVSTKSSGAFCGLNTATVPTTGTPSGIPRIFRPASRDPARNLAVSNPLRIRRHRSRRKIPSCTPVRMFSSDTATNASVQRDAILSNPT